MKARNLLTADEFTLAEAACMLQFTDPMAAMMNAQTRYLDETHEAIADMITAIEGGELPLMSLPDDLFRRNGDQAGPYVYAATNWKDLYTPEAHERRSRYGVRRGDLVAFADAHEYPAVALLIGEVARPGISSVAGRIRGGRKGAETKRLEKEIRNRKIRKRLGESKSVREVAAEFDLSESQVRRIR